MQTTSWGSGGRWVNISSKREPTGNESTPWPARSSNCASIEDVISSA